MRVLVTRPEPDASETAAKLKALGHEAVVVPLLSIVLAAPPTEIPDPQAVVLTSRNGVRALATWPQVAGWLKRPAYVTGEATAREARTIGFSDLRAGSGDASALAPLIRADLAKGSGSILYPAARDRASAFAEDLAAEGYDVRIVQAYRAEPAAGLDEKSADALRSGAIEAALFYSQRTAARFRQLVDETGIADGLDKTTLLALSTRVAEPLHGLPARIMIADHPNEESLFSLLARDGH